MRAASLADSMSQYLIDQLGDLPNVEVRLRSQVAGFDASDRLRAITVSSADHAHPVSVPADALFICIGGTPRTDGAAGVGLAMNHAGYLVTGGEAADRRARDWPLSREPMPLETNVPACSPRATCAAARSSGALRR